MFGIWVDIDPAKTGPDRIGMLVEPNGPRRVLVIYLEVHLAGAVG